MSPVVPVVVKLIVPPLPVVAAAVAPTALADRASLLEKAKVPPLSEMVPPPEVLLAFMVPPGTVKAPPPASSRTAPGSPSAVEGVLADMPAAELSLMPPAPELITLIWPALPVTEPPSATSVPFNNIGLLELAEIEMLPPLPLATPDKTRPVVTVTVPVPAPVLASAMAPPPPRGPVTPTLMPPALTVRLRPALIDTDPPLPPPEPPVADMDMVLPVPPMTRSLVAPEAVTETEPPAPVPEPLALTANVPLLTAMEAPASVTTPPLKLPLAEPLTVSGEAVPSSNAPLLLNRLTEQPAPAGAFTLRALASAILMPPALSTILIVPPAPPELPASALKEPFIPLTGAGELITKLSGLPDVSSIVPPAPVPTPSAFSGELMERFPVPAAPAVSKMSGPAAPLSGPVCSGPACTALPVTTVRLRPADTAMLPPAPSSELSLPPVALIWICPAAVPRVISDVGPVALRLTVPPLALPRPSALSVSEPVALLLVTPRADSVTAPPSFVSPEAVTCPPGMTSAPAGADSDTPPAVPAAELAEIAAAEVKIIPPLPLLLMLMVPAGSLFGPPSAAMVPGNETGFDEEA